MFSSFFVLAVPAGASAKPEPGSPAPAFTLPSEQGSVSLESLRGKIILVDFWASWCGPCRMSFPWLKQMHDRYTDKGLVVVAVNLDKARPPAEGFLADFSVPFTVAFDPAGKTAESFGLKAMPSTYLIGRDGVLLASEAGYEPKRAAEMEERIKQACTP